MLKKLLLLCLLALPLSTLAESAKEVEVLMKTSKGDFTLTLYPGKAPKTVANFLRYVDEGFYDGTIFHRVIPGFMIQGGGLTPDLKRKPTHAPVENEAGNGLKNVRGSIAMARTSDPHSATSQFFINHRDNPNLDYPNPDGWGYAVFGKVSQGMDVVDAIASVPTVTRDDRENVPLIPVIIESARRKP